MMQFFTMNLILCPFFRDYTIFEKISHLFTNQYPINDLS